MGVRGCIPSAPRRSFGLGAAISRAGFPSGRALEPLGRSAGMRNARGFHNPALKTHGNPRGCGALGMIQPRFQAPSSGLDPGLALPNIPRFPCWETRDPSRSFPRSHGGSSEGDPEGASLPTSTGADGNQIFPSDKTRFKPLVNPRIPFLRCCGSQDSIFLGAGAQNWFVFPTGNARLPKKPSRKTLPKVRTCSRSIQQRFFLFFS